MTPAGLADVRGQKISRVRCSAPSHVGSSGPTARLYLRRLMLDGRRKSMVPMAERLGVDPQRLQQFVTSSTWDHLAVRRRLAQRAVDVVAPGWACWKTPRASEGR